MTDKCKDVIGKRSEESHKSLLPQSLRFFTSFRLTDKSKDVIGNVVKNLKSSCINEIPRCAPNEPLWLL